MLPEMEKAKAVATAPREGPLEFRVKSESRKETDSGPAVVISMYLTEPFIMRHAETAKLVGQGVRLTAVPAAGGEEECRVISITTGTFGKDNKTRQRVKLSTGPNGQRWVGRTATLEALQRDLPL